MRLLYNVEVWKMKYISTIFLPFIVVGFLVATSVVAQTPDGETPAQETVCDELKGATPGLYGLCVAYCEAQDLDEFMQTVQNGKIPGEKIIDKYRAKMKDGDPDMPCLVSAPTCPCFAGLAACQAAYTGAPNEACMADYTQPADVFAGISCNTTDRCRNIFFSSTGNTQADAFCLETSQIGGQRFANLRAVDFGNDTGFCQAVQQGVGTNHLRLDGATAQQCIQEMHAFYGNTDAIVTLDPCYINTLGQ